MMVLSETLDRFQDLSSVKQVNSKFVFFRGKLKLCVIVNYVDKIMSITLLFLIFLYFQGHSSVKQFESKILCSYAIKMELGVIVTYVYQIITISLFLTFARIQGI